MGKSPALDVLPPEHLHLVPDGPRRITATRAGFRRAGRAWPAAPGELVDPEALTPAQWTQVAADPLLIVSVDPPA